MAEPDLVENSCAVLAAVGFQFIPLLHPIAGVWSILCVSPRGLTLVSPVSEAPTLTGATYSAPAGWPPVVRLILIWGDGSLPTALTLS
jgi:hypothetical protein